MAIYRKYNSRNYPNSFTPTQNPCGEIYGLQPEQRRLLEKMYRDERKYDLNTAEELLIEMILDKNHYEDRHRKFLYEIREKYILASKPQVDTVGGELKQQLDEFNKRLAEQELNISKPLQRTSGGISVYKPYENGVKNEPMVEHDMKKEDSKSIMSRFIDFIYNL